MKILILANNDTGLYQFRKELISEFLTPSSYIEGRENEPFEVYVSLPNGEFVKEFEKMGCKFIETPIDRRGMNPLRELKLLKTYKKIIKEVKPNVVLTYTIKPNIYGSMACKKYKVPYITNITGLGSAIEKGGVSKKLLLFLYKRALNKAQCVFFQNQSNKEFFERKKIALGKHKMLPGSGVNLERYKVSKYPDENNGQFTFIGRVMKEKGIEEYLQSASEIKKKYPDFIFNILGSIEEEYQGKLNEYIENKTVIYHGSVKDVKPYIEKSFAVILPSYHEGLANVLLESSSMGRPVIASKVHGCIETFDEGISGFGVEIKSANDLLEKIEKFINLPYEQKVQMGLNARQKVEREFDRKIVVKKYLEEIEKLK